ncbi:TPA: hypothetical protein QDB28_005225 [Burkholderia vietnamiensis]|uniref:hypothetical protein n=1 Tax=Burkholderia vietnamiensis TaxID=60552 RepID=UPI00158BF15F|nr:hypothetical protein [Burkholderia vietnamiensis]HDR9164790.1 hypothetical protein [Burkholderia vietnamiensis]
MNLDLDRDVVGEQPSTYLPAVLHEALAVHNEIRPHHTYFLQNRLLIAAHRWPKNPDTTGAAASAASAIGTTACTAASAEAMPAAAFGAAADTIAPTASTTGSTALMVSATDGVV